MVWSHIGVILTAYGGLPRVVRIAFGEAIVNEQSFFFFLGGATLFRANDGLTQNGVDDPAACYTAVNSLSLLLRMIPTEYHSWDAFSGRVGPSRPVKFDIQRSHEQPERMSSRMPLATRKAVEFVGRIFLYVTFAQPLVLLPSALCKHENTYLVVERKHRTNEMQKT